MLTFPDGTQAGVFGLDEAFTAVYAEGKQVDADTVHEILEQLSERNYITPTARHQYAQLLFEEYGRYVENQKSKRQDLESVTSSFPHANRRARCFSRLFRRASAKSRDTGDD